MKFKKLLKKKLKLENKANKLYNKYSALIGKAKKIEAIIQIKALEL